MKFWVKVLILILLMGFFSCSRQSDEPLLFTGRVLNREDVTSQLPNIILGKNQYAEVNSRWLLWCYNDFKQWIGEGAFGVIKWDDRSECTFFTTAFEAYAQRAYFRQAFHSNISAPGIALGSFWYVPSPNLGHALIVVMTQDGIQFFEPQTGKFVVLNVEQILSKYLNKFD